MPSESQPSIGSESVIPTAPATAVPGVAPTITIDDFAKVDLRVARVIAALSDERTSWMTGNIIGVDGGEEIIAH